MAKELLSLLDRRRNEVSPIGRAVFRLLIAIEKLRLVDPVWRLKLSLRDRGQRCLRIGFGPIIEREKTLGFRKWAIDPIVDEINRTSRACAADIFFGDEDLSRFDVLVIVKNFETLTRENVEALKAAGKVLVYNPRDNPAGCRKDYREHDWFTHVMDGFILSSPAQQAEFEMRGQDHRVIGTPVINRRVRKVYRDSGTLQLVWQGYRTNAACMERLHPIIGRINRESANRMCLIYHSDRPPERAGDPGVRFAQWRISNWEDMLVSSDIGVVIKPAGDPLQQQKPPTKVVSYMAAGLPVVCTPSPADRQVIEHGRTGFFAETDDEWRELLILLAEDRQLRERIGQAGREHVFDTFGVDRIAADYLAYVDALRAALLRPA